MIHFSPQNEDLLNKRWLWLAGGLEGGHFGEDEGVKEMEDKEDKDEMEDRDEDLRNQEEGTESQEGVEGGVEEQPSGEALAEQALEITTKSDTKLMEQLAAANSNPEAAEYPAADIQSVVAERIQAGEAAQAYDPMRQQMEENRAITFPAVVGIVGEIGPEKPA